MSKNKGVIQLQMHRVYLGGPMPMSGLRAEDLAWRKRIVEDLSSYYQIVDPVLSDFAEKDLPPSTITRQDLWAVRRCHIAVFNLFRFGEPGYACIGSLIEMGVAHEARALIYVVTHGNDELNNHPFIRDIATNIYDTEKDLIDYLIKFRKFIGCAAND